MNLDEGQIVTLDNNKDYIVVKSVVFNETTYVYLMTNRKPLEVLIVKLQDVGGSQILKVVDSKEELEEIINLFEK